MTKEDQIKEVMGLVRGYFVTGTDEAHDAIESKLRELLPAWLPIDAAPVNRTVLLGFRNENGNWRSTRGAWMDEVEIASWENDDYPVGWYETPVEGEECFYIEPTHWMPLPKEPV